MSELCSESLSATVVFSSFLALLFLTTSDFLDFLREPVCFLISVFSSDFSLIVSFESSSKSGTDLSELFGAISILFTSVLVLVSTLKLFSLINSFLIDKFICAIVLFSFDEVLGAKSSTGCSIGSI